MVFLELSEASVHRFPLRMFANIMQGPNAVLAAVAMGGVDADVLHLRYLACLAA